MGREETKIIVRFFIGALFISFFFLLPVLNAAPQTQVLQSKVDEYINGYQKKEKFSGFIIIAQKGQVLVSEGYGMANCELDIPKNPQTKFYINSITRQFAITGTMQLQEKRLLNIDDNACIIMLSSMLPARYIDVSEESKINQDLKAIVFGEKFELPKD